VPNNSLPEQKPSSRMHFSITCALISLVKTAPYDPSTFKCYLLHDELKRLNTIGWNHVTWHAMKLTVALSTPTRAIMKNSTCLLFHSPLFLCNILTLWETNFSEQPMLGHLYMYYRVPTGPEKSWNLTLDFSVPEKSWNWTEVLKKSWIWLVCSWKNESVIE